MSAGELRKTGHIRKAQSITLLQKRFEEIRGLEKEKKEKDDDEEKKKGKKKITHGNGRHGFLRLTITCCAVRTISSIPA